MAVGGFAFLFAPRGVSEQLPVYMGLCATAVSLWAFELIPPPLTAAGLTFSFILVLGLDAEFVFLPWSTTLIWIAFGGCLFGEAMKGTGLAKRIALQCLMLVGGSFGKLLLGFGLAGMVMGFLLPSIFARVVIFCAIGASIVEALKIIPKSRLSSAIILMAFFAATAPCFLFLHTSENFIWAFEVLFGKNQTEVSFWQYVVHGSLINVLYTVFSMLCVYIVKGKEALNSPQEVYAAVSAEYKKLHVMSGAEVRLLVLVAIGIGAFMLEPFTGLNAVFLFAATSVLCYVPTLKIQSQADFQQVNIMFLVMMAGCISMGMAGNVVGANKWAVGQVVPFLSQFHPAIATIAAYVSGVFVNFILTPLAATAAFTPAFHELGQQMGINPLPVFYAFNYGLDQYVLPYEMVPFLYIFTIGYVRLGHIVAALAMRALLTLVLLCAVAIPYWMFIGIL